MRTSTAEAALIEYMAYHHIGGYVREHQFHPVRKWRLDFAWPDLLFGVEAEGITYYGKVPGRHQGRPGFEDDCEKYEAAMLLGWRVYRVPHTWILEGSRRIWRPEVAETIRHFVLVGR